jgi:hypothetical protein
MNISKLIEILRWPSTKRNGMNPWYVILWRLFFLPFVMLFGLGFYLTTLLSTFDFYEAELFKRDYWF